MARDSNSDSRKEAQFIANEFLDAQPDNKLGQFIAHLGNTALCRRKLLQYIKKWRLKLHTHQKFKDDDGNDTSWDEVADEEDLLMLYAIEPFLIWCQNDYGPDHYLYENEDRMDITKIPRSAFLDYFYGPFDLIIQRKKIRNNVWRNGRGGIQPVHKMVVVHHPLVHKMARALLHPQATRRSQIP